VVNEAFLRHLWDALCPTTLFAQDLRDRMPRLDWLPISRQLYHWDGYHTLEVSYEVTSTGGNLLLTVKIPISRHTEAQRIPVSLDLLSRARAVAQT